MSLSHDGKHFACRHGVWNAETLTLEYFIDGDHLWNDFDKWKRTHSWKRMSPETEEGEIFLTFGKGVPGVLTRDNKRFLCQDGGKLLVFDVETGDMVLKDQVFNNHASVFTLGVSPDGRCASQAALGRRLAWARGLCRATPTNCISTACRRHLRIRDDNRDACQARGVPNLRAEPVQSPLPATGFQT